MESDHVERARRRTACSGVTSICHALPLMCVGLRHRIDVRQLAQVGGVVVEADLGVGGRVDGDADRRRPASRRTRGRARGRPGGPASSSGSTLASTPVNCTLKNGSPAAMRTPEARVAIGSGRRMTPRESRYQKPACSPLAASCGRALPALRRERVHARAEHGQQRGQRDQRRGGGHDRADEPAGAHRVEEALREDQQRGERGADRRPR